MHKLHLFRLLLLLLVAGCLEPDLAPLRIEPQTTPFYLYQGERVYLQADSLRLTVQADTSRLHSALTQLIAAGYAVDSVAPLYFDRSHSVLWLAPTTTAADALEAAKLLRLAPGVRFASVAYLYVPPDPARPCVLLLPNRVAVRYKASVTPRQIAQLHDQADLTVERPATASWQSWTLRYPVGTPYTPLEIAAALYRHPFVEWADPDMAGCMTLHGL